MTNGAASEPETITIPLADYRGLIHAWNNEQCGWHRGMTEAAEFCTNTEYRLINDDVALAIKRRILNARDNTPKP